MSVSAAILCLSACDVEHSPGVSEVYITSWTNLSFAPHCKSKPPGNMAAPSVTPMQSNNNNKKDFSC